MATRTGINTAPITWPAFVEATDRLREATAALARLIADTLAVQYHGAAAYLVLEEYDDGDFMNLHSLLDADGRRLAGTRGTSGTKATAPATSLPITARITRPADPSRVPCASIQYQGVQAI
ncbi:hypothetical protein [Streptomyces mirabilis]|uniref:hypothetical protein n=1 Tax=Streptomyces mirabilis TaxID=68239 RepID=UPI0036AF75F6